MSRNAAMVDLVRKSVKRQGKLSDELYLRIHSHINWQSNTGFKNRMIHLADAVDCGTITPMAAHDALDQLEQIGYLPIWVDVRESNYSHLLGA